MTSFPRVDRNGSDAFPHCRILWSGPSCVNDESTARKPSHVETLHSIDTALEREVRPLRGAGRGLRGGRARLIDPPGSYCLLTEDLARLEPSFGWVRLGEGDQPAVGVEQSNLSRGDAGIGEIPGGEPPAGGHGGNLIRIEHQPRNTSREHPGVVASVERSIRSKVLSSSTAFSIVNVPIRVRIKVSTSPPQPSASPTSRAIERM